MNNQSFFLNFIFKTLNCNVEEHKYPSNEVYQNNNRHFLILFFKKKFKSQKKKKGRNLISKFSKLSISTMIFTNNL